MRRRAHTVMDSPVGPLTLVAADGALTGLYMDRQLYRPAEETFGDRDPEPFAEAVEQLEEYFAGRRTEFDLPLLLNGTPFQRQVWAELRSIPFGATASYGELAERLGRPTTAARAVGMANGRNPISIIVPCHRVVGSTGALTGYGGGLDRKERLLAFERDGREGVANGRERSPFPPGCTRRAGSRPAVREALCPSVSCASW